MEHKQGRWKNGWYKGYKNTAKNIKMYAIRYTNRITRIRSQTKEISTIKRIKPLKWKRDARFERR